MAKSESIEEIRRRLVEVGGRTSQDLGANRILGQILIFLYLQEKECSLPYISAQLGLSKASVSIAARQLEKLGLIKRVWVTGDRKNYYKSAENIAGALQEGLLALVRQKVQMFGEELDAVEKTIEAAGEENSGQTFAFLRHRVQRASKLQKRLKFFLENPLVKFFT